MKHAREVKIKQSVIAELEAGLVARLRLRGSAPRVELARELNLAPSTVGIYVDRLIAEGLIREGPRIAGQTGRPATLLTLNPDGGRFVGVDIEARNVVIVVLDFSQKPLAEIRVRLNKGETADSVLGKLLAEVGALVEGAESPLLGIGVGVPGAVDVVHGVGVHYEHIRGWRDVAVARTLKERFGVPVFLENNIRSMALAEMWSGAARGVDSFLCMGVRSGIGAGIVTRGRLQHGRDYLAGEIGSWPCPTRSAESAAQGFEPLESLASLSALVARMNRRASADGEWTADRLLEAARAGDRVVCECLQDAAHACGWVAGQLNLALNVDLIVLAGPLTTLGDQFLTPLEAAVRSSLPPLHAAMPRVECSRLGPSAGALGAAALAVQQWKPTR